MILFCRYQRSSSVLDSLFEGARKQFAEFQIEIEPKGNELKFNPLLTKPTVNTGLLIVIGMGPEMEMNAMIAAGPTPGGGGSARRFVIRNTRTAAPGSTTATPGNTT